MVSNRDIALEQAEINQIEIDELKAIFNSSSLNDNSNPLDDIIQEDLLSEYFGFIGTGAL